MKAPAKRFKNKPAGASASVPLSAPDQPAPLSRSPLPGELGVGLLNLRTYQAPVFDNHKSGILILHWSRQIGKSHTLAAWCVDRLMRQLAKNDTWLITVLSNSRDNGGEFVLKCQLVCNQLGILMHTTDQSADLKYENMRMEVRVSFMSGKNTERTGRIKVLAANPRTARGFSGDLILD